jgi:hypothetical protein
MRCGSCTFIPAFFVITQVSYFALRKARRIIKGIQQSTTSPTLFDVRVSVAARFIAPALLSRPE